MNNTTKITISVFGSLIGSIASTLLLLKIIATFKGYSFMCVRPFLIEKVVESDRVVKYIEGIGTVELNRPSANECFSSEINFLLIFAILVTFLIIWFFLSKRIFARF